MKAKMGVQRVWALWPPEALQLWLLVLVMLLAVSCRDKAAEERNRKAVETRIADRERQVAAVKAEAAQRLTDGLRKVPLFDREAARRKLVLEKFKFDLATTPLRSREEARKMLDERAAAAADEIFPPSKRTALMAKAIKEYPSYKVGDTVVIETHTNRGANGAIEAIGDDYVKVRGVRILLADIRSPDPACFSEEACEKQRRYVVHVNYDAPRRDQLELQTARLLPEVMKESGFILWQNKWTRIDELYQPVIDPLVVKQEEAFWKETEDRLRSEIEIELLKEGKLPLPPPVPNPFEKKD